MTRTASEVGAGLAPARTARPIPAGQRIHVVGMSGAGASAAALLAHAAGAIVSGCDVGGPSSYTDALDVLGIQVIPGHAAEHVTGDPRPERLAVTKALTAIVPDHPELVAARTAGVAVESWQQVVADAAAGRRLVAVAGTHGKSTTSGWLVSLLVDAGLDPSAFVGALLPPAMTGSRTPATARSGTGDLFVVEADEYADNFAPYRPDVAVLTGRRMGSPGRVRRCGRRPGRIRRLAGGGPCRFDGRRERRRRRWRQPSSMRWPVWDRRFVLTALIDDPDLTDGR